jgi:hypothetical protein
MSKPIKDRWSQHYEVVRNDNVISCAMRNTLCKRGRVLTNYFCKPAEKSGIRSVNTTLSRWISVKLCDLMKTGGIHREGTPIQLSQRSCSGRILLRWKRCLHSCVSLPWWNFIYTRDTVTLLEMLLLFTQFSWHDFTSADTCSVPQPR